MTFAGVTRRGALTMLFATSVARAGAVAPDVPALAAEFRALRVQRGHFSGGSWNDALDKWGGRKHEVMSQLGIALGDGKHTRRAMTVLMGQPDRILLPGRNLFGLGRFRRHGELLVYDWRGQHDFLYFTSDGRRILAYDWWAALE